MGPFIPPFAILKLKVERFLLEMVVCQFETLHVHLIANFQNIVYMQAPVCLWKVNYNDNM